MIKLILLCSLVFASGWVHSVEWVDEERVPGHLPAETPHSPQWRFIVLPDRTGGHRPGVFQRSIERAARLHADLVLNVGDLVEGYTRDKAQITAQWRDVMDALEELGAPVFLVPGNHDLSNSAMRSWWENELGSSYGAFRHRNTLFLLMDTEDPPIDIPDTQIREYRASKASIAALSPDDPKKAALEAALRQRSSRWMKTAISEEQLDYFQRVLADNQDVAWTFVLLHKPAWQGTYAHDGFQRFESLLADRHYTVIAGHTHVYSHERRFGNDYFTLGTLGGGVHQPGAAGSIDHLFMVTMTAEGPTIVNLLASGILPPDGVDTAPPPERLFAPAAE